MAGQSVGVVGSGPAATAAEAALADVDVEVDALQVDGVTEVDLAVVVGQAGDTTLELVNEHALETRLRWIGVELGSVGGFPVVNGAVAGFGPETGCYECLSGRVGANLDPQAEPAAAPPAYTARFAGALAGREAARYLEEGDDSIFGSVVEVPYAEREFLPLPHCACASAHDWSVPEAVHERDLDESLARAERAVDSRVGVVQEIGEAESFPIPYYLAHSCDSSGFSDATAARDAAGVAPGWDAAFMKGLGEAMERYSAGVYRLEGLERGLPDEVEDAVGPDRFVTQSDDVGEPIPWVAAEDLDSGENVRVPAEFVFYPPPSRQFRPAVTTGLGLGNDGPEALLAGLYELIERDATMLAWYSTFDPVGVEVVDDTWETVVSRAESEGLTVDAVLLTQDVDVPVVAVAVHGEAFPRFAVGSSAHLDATHAANSALAEALQNWMELRGMGPEGAAQASGEIGHHAEEPGEALAFVRTDSAVPAASLGDDGGDREAELETVLGALADADLEAYATRLTTRDLATAGFESVRCLVPRAQPLFFGEAYFGERAETVPEAMDFEPTLDRDHHPFP